MYFLRVRTISTNLRIRNEFQNKKIKIFDFRNVSISRNSEISAVLHLVVPNVDPHPYEILSTKLELIFFNNILIKICKIGSAFLTSRNWKLPPQICFQSPKTPQKIKCKNFGYKEEYAWKHLHNVYWYNTNTFGFEM